MTKRSESRYEQVSRRAALKTLGAGALAIGAGACSNADAQVFAGAVAEPVETTTSTTTSTTTTTEATTTTEPTTTTAEDSATTDPEPEETTTTEAPSTEATDPTEVAVAGTMVVSFTYTRVGAGKIESPYVAVWVENTEGELLQTISLWYEQGRRGARWLDHLNRWWAVDTERISAGGVDSAATISSATRAPGAYAVAWDGLVDGAAAPAGDYFLCIESSREDGPYSLIREPITLTGTLPETPLPDNAELSEASVRIDA